MCDMSDMITDIDKPYNDFIEYAKDLKYISIGEIDVIIRAKGGNLFELIRRKLLIQHPEKLNLFKCKKSNS